MDTQDKPGLVYGRYTVMRKIGEGAMGQVFIAHDPILERNVALKVIAINPILARASRAEYLERFHTEAKASAKLDHPSIVKVYDAGQQNEEPWIAFQLVEGESLEDLLKRRSQLSVRRVVAFAIDIASALQHAHGWNIVHRDIKPANILIEAKTGVAKLADFGIVKAPWAAETQEGNAVGSPGYMAPEQIEGGEVDHRADLFSFGVVLYQMLTGRHPFLRDTVATTAFATCKGEYRPISELVKNVPPILEKAVRRCLVPDARRRIGSADELLDYLHSVAAPDKGTTHTRHPIVAVADIGSTRKETARSLPLGENPEAFIARKKLERKLGSLARTLSDLSKIVWAQTANVIDALIAQLRRIPALSRPGSKFVLMGGSIGLASIAALAMIVVLFSQGLPYPSRNSPEGRLVRLCQYALEHNDRNRAHECVQRIAGLTSDYAAIHLLVARIYIRDGNYDDAAGEIARAKSCRKGDKVISGELPQLTSDIKRALRKGPASLALIDLTTQTLSLANVPAVRTWLKDDNRWVRENTEEILAVSGWDGR
jgi:serine/threonine protein kinase